jgi:hypothetical protein
LAFTRNPATGLPATYTGTQEVDAIILFDQPSQIRIEGVGAPDSIILNALALDVQALRDYKVYGNDGGDSITVSSNIFSSIVQGGRGKDILFINAIATNSFIRGGNNDDFMSFVSGSSTTFNGNKGSDTLEVGGGNFSNSSIFGGSESDRIDLFGSVLTNTTVNGDNGADFINTFGNVSSQNSSINGGAANDIITVNPGNFSSLLINGGNDNDIIDILCGGPAPGFTNSGNNTINGDAGNDTVSFRNVGPAVSFITGNNTVDTSTGADTVNFGLGTTTGFNTYVWDRGDSVASTSFANGVPAPPADPLRLDNTDKITFGNGVDVITGFSAANDVINLDFTPTLPIDNINGQLLTDVLQVTGIFEITGTYTGNVFEVNAAGVNYLYVLSGANNTIGNTVNGASTNMVISDTKLFDVNFV